MTVPAVTMLEPPAGLAELLDELVAYALAVPGTWVALIHRDLAYAHNDDVIAAAGRAGQPITGNGNRWTLGNGSRLAVRRVARLDDAYLEAGSEFAAIGFHELGHLEPVAVDYLLARLRVSPGHAEALETAGRTPLLALATQAAA